MRNDDLKFFQTAQAQKLAQTAEAKAWEYFLLKFPGADKSKFTAQVDFDDNRKAKAEMFLKEGPGLLQSVFGTKRRYWPM